MPRRERLYGSVIGWEGWQFAIVSSLKGLRYVDLHGSPLSGLSERLNAHVAPDDERNLPALRELREYLAGERELFSIPLDIQGTPFQQSVWKAIRGVPYGKTTSYEEIAVRVGRPKATRAVGQAVGANPVPIFIPCHRIVGKQGDLTGYGGGLPLKERLLALEHGSLDL